MTLAQTALMDDRSPAARKAFLRFLAVGVVNTAFGYGVYAVGIMGGLPAQTALALQFLLGVLWNYRMHARWVFAVEGWGRLPAYVGAYLLIWALNALALRVLLSVGLGALAAQALILPATVALSWLLIGRVMGFSRRSTPARRPS